MNYINLNTGHIACVCIHIESVTFVSSSIPTISVFPHKFFLTNFFNKIVTQHFFVIQPHGKSVPNFSNKKLIKFAFRWKLTLKC